MKALTWLAVLTCLSGAWALKCYRCLNANDKTCSQEVECQPQEQACVSITTTVSNGNEAPSVLKGCGNSCSKSVPWESQNALQKVKVEQFSYCCTTDLCNRAGGRGPGTTTALILLTGTLITLLGAVL